MFFLNKKIFRREFNKKSTIDFDYVYDGGVLDNVWNPSNAMMNLVSRIKPKGRIINWAVGTNWPGTMCAISPEWLLGFYTINNFTNVRVYSFCVVNDGTVYPNLTVNVFVIILVSLRIRIGIRLKLQFLNLHTQFLLLVLQICQVKFQKI